MTRINQPHPKYKQPSTLRDWDDESPTFLDTQDFNVFCVRVKNIIDELYLEMERAVWIAEIKRRVGEDHPYKDSLADALDALKGIGSIEQVTEVSPIRYAPKEIPKKRKVNYMNRDAGKAKIKPDSESLYGEGFERI